MNVLFVTVIYFIALLIATTQDLRRREVDNWLNYGLLYFGFIAIVYISFFVYDVNYLLNGIFLIILGFIFHYLFYYGRVFAGGDAKLLLALSPYFVSTSFTTAFSSFVLFILLMFVSGGVYGLTYSLCLYFLHFKKSTKRVLEELSRMHYLFFFILGCILIILGMYVYLLFVFGVFSIFFPLLFAFARGLESVVMIKNISTSKLREGDWLVSDVVVGKKVVKATFEGVTLDEIELLKKKKSVTIKEGLPFVPSFLFAFIIYYFFSEQFLNFIVKLVL